MIGERRAFYLCVAAVALCLVAPPAHAQKPATPSDIRIPVSDARNVGPKSVRFAAALATTDSPAIVLLGGNKKVWPKIVAAAQQATFDGYPVAGIFVGPPDAKPALEIYATAHHVTYPIDPNTISQAELAKLLRDVSREYYPR